MSASSLASTATTRAPNTWPTPAQHLANTRPTPGQHPPNTWPTPAQHLANTRPTPGQHPPNTWPTPAQHLANTRPTPGQHPPNTWPTPAQHLANTRPTPAQHPPNTRLTPPSASRPAQQRTTMSRHHPDLVMCRKQSGISIGRLCDKCDGKCPVCDSYVRPTTLARICDECSFGNYQNKCVVCGGEGISDAFYCFECTRLEKDRDGCPKIINLGSSRTDLFYQKKNFRNH
ncbi:hypothetical protein ST47_g6603 [Ascochyta rabiei]|nr:hypothetical protein ST47_g6603 [Ascochyta rabiei]